MSFDVSLVRARTLVVVVYVGGTRGEGGKEGLRMIEIYLVYKNDNEGILIR